MIGDASAFVCEGEGHFDVCLLDASGELVARSSIDGQVLAHAWRFGLVQFGLR
ncbi:hypothetical protein [Virgisporangium ochraceum]|uniref:hypothetical protein n=1 Tax=Virgisporangium ochraceum TaxID=65505 RepID=UPI0019428242|nr:hypothetical protein [Virgisporangium ochraceum]